MTSKKKSSFGVGDAIAIIILAFTLGFFVYLGWEVALFLTVFIGFFGPVMSILGTRRETSLVIEQYRGWSDPNK